MTSEITATTGLLCDGSHKKLANALNTINPIKLRTIIAMIV
jgi:hypothetical protein